MIRFVIGCCTLLMLLALMPVNASAQVDNFGVPDTIWADVAKIDDHHWTITVSYFNDEVVLGLSVPFRMTSGLNQIVADSAVFTGGRVEHFGMKSFRADTAIQCVLLGMVGPGASKKVLLPGKGRLATIYVSSLENKPIEKLDVDTTTVNPQNSLMAVADSLQGTPPDTVRVAQKDAIIIPAFVVRKE
ncbi:MAG: hypothetical protein IPH75_00830 [bacterium]|nr:hypothetical protein [bacterium]